MVAPQGKEPKLGSNTSEPALNLPSISPSQHTYETALEAAAAAASAMVKEKVKQISASRASGHLAGEPLGTPIIDDMPEGTLYEIM